MPRSRTQFARLGAPTDVAGAVAFLATDDAPYISGTNLLVDGGWLAPPPRGAPRPRRRNPSVRKFEPHTRRSQPAARSRRCAACGGNRHSADQQLLAAACATHRSTRKRAIETLGGRRSSALSMLSAARSWSSVNH